LAQLYRFWDLSALARVTLTLGRQFCGGFHESKNRFGIKFIQLLKVQVLTESAATFQNYLGILKLGSLRERQLDVSLVVKDNAELPLFSVGKQSIKCPFLFLDPGAL